MALLIVGGCHDPANVRNVQASAVFDTEALDFGEVPVGEYREQKVTLQNAGYVPFTAGEVLQLQNNPSFQVTLNGDAKVLPGQSRDVVVRFHPLHEGDLQDAFGLATDAEHHPPPVALRGKGTPTPILVDPPVLDFQTLETDSDRSLPVTVTNPVDLPLALLVGGNDAGQFASDTVIIPPYAKVTVNARYLPHAEGKSGADLEVRSCDSCTPTNVTLAGRAVKSALVFDPAPVPFDAIPVHETTQSFTQVTNITWRPVDVAQLQTSDYAFQPITNLAGTVINPGETVKMEVSFAARYSGPAMGTLDVNYVTDKPRTTDVLLDARGGRPTIALAPVSIDFGDQPVGTRVEKVIRISNAGSNGNLTFLGVRGEGTNPDQFGVGDVTRGKTVYPWSSPYPHAGNSVAIAPGTDFIEVRVAFEPLRAGTFQAQLTFLSDDLFTPERPVIVTGQAHDTGPCTFRVLPQPRIDFGNVPVGSGAVLGFRFENAGTNVCAVKNIHLSQNANGAFFMPGGALAGGTVLENDAFSAQVAFKPPANGQYSGEVEITVSNPDTPVIHLPLRGVATDTCLTAAPNFLDFGAIRYDCATAPLHTYVANQCATPVTVSSVWLGDGTSNQFTILDQPGYPTTLQPGQGFELGVAFSRQVLGQHFTPMYVQAEGENAALLIPLLGEVNHEGVNDDRYVQGRDGQLDLLFVVGNTTTMQQYQNRLKSEIPAFVAQLAAQQVDLHAAVTSTGLVERGATCGGGANGGEAGRLFPADGSSTRIITGTDANAATALSADLSVGTCHNLVQGLETMRAALSSPLVDHQDDPRTPLPNDGNLGFFRPTAKLAVVFLADEDDHSGFDPQSYTQFLQSLEGPTAGNRIAAYAIVPTDPSCTTAGPPGPRFAQVAQSTGGVVLNVCNDSYAAVLDPIAQRAINAEKVFRLGGTPASAADIRVFVDQTDMAGKWSYDPAQNAVVFDAGSVPTPGQEIDIRYRSVCK